MQGIPSIKFGLNTESGNQYKAGLTIIYPKDNPVTQQEEWKVAFNIVKDLIESGVNKMGEGYCISVSDICLNLCKQNGLSASLLEVKLSIVDQEDGTTHMVGHDVSWEKNSHTKISTHVVVAVNAKIPFFMDLSIAHRLPNQMQAVMNVIKNEGSKIISNFVFGKKTGFLYQEKIDGIGVPKLHQISILDRMATDRFIFSEMKQLKILNIIGIIISSFALINVMGKILFDWYN